MKAKLFLAASLFAITSINAQLSEINEDFSGFSQQNFPQNGWTSNRTYPYAYLIPGQYAQSYSLFDAANPTYIITPEIVSPDGTKKIKFDAQVSTGSGGSGTIQVGLLTSATDMSTFQSISTVETLQATATTYTFDVPASSGKYIAFKFQPSTVHAALQVDNVVYGTNLAVNESASNSNTVKFAVSKDNNSLIFATQTVFNNAKVYNSAGQIATEGKIINNLFDITRLKTGVYFIVVEDKNGQSAKSKFIKK